MMTFALTQERFAKTGAVRMVSAPGVYATVSRDILVRTAQLLRVHQHSITTQQMALVALLVPLALIRTYTHIHAYLVRLLAVSVSTNRHYALTVNQPYPAQRFST
jgi:hypothetical protein